VKKLSLIVLCLALGSFAFGATTWITVLGEPPENNGTYQAAMRYLEVSNGRVYVNWIPTAWGGIRDKMLIAFASGSVDFDLVYTWAGWTAEVYRNFLPIQSKLPQNFKKGWIESAFQAVSFGNDVYGLPADINLYLFFWNKKHYKDAGLDPEKPPTDFNELVANAKKLTRDLNGDGTIDQYGFVGAWFTGDTLLMNFELWLYLNGGQMLDKNNKPVFNSPQGVQALTAMSDLLNTHKVMDPGSLDYGNPAARQVFNAGRASQICMWPSQWTEANNPDKAAKDVVGNAGISIIPAYSKSITGSATVNAPEGYAITRAAEKRGVVDEAVKLLQYLTTADVQIQDFKQRGRLPVLQQCFVDPALANDAKFGPVVKVALQQSPYPNFRFSSEYQAKIVDALMPELFNALKGKKTPKEALDAAAALAAKSIPSK